MAELRPFRGIRYNQEAIGDLSLVVAPPYDIIGPDSRDHFYNKHPYNVIRLILNKPKKSDTHKDQPYERAAQFYQRWLATRILVRETEPCIYLYRQRYLQGSQYKECTGLVARVRVEDFESGVVLPHENIMPKSLEDRVKLLEKTQANLSMVHAIYSDPEEKLRQPMLKEMERFPLAQFQTEDGVAHDLWGVSDTRFAKRVVRFFDRKTLYIADGHHRYQTALEYSKSLIERGEDDGNDDPRRFLMMMIVEMENPGLSIMPVHRVVLADGKIDAKAFIACLEPWFDVEDVETPGTTRSGKVFHLLKKIEEEGRTRKSFGVFLAEPERFLMIRLRDEKGALSEMEEKHSEAYKGLDATILHKIVLERVLGISPDGGSVERNILFTMDAMEALEMVESGKGNAAFFMNSTRVEQVKDVAEACEKMPQKSTYFYPKPFSGVVMNDITTW